MVTFNVFQPIRGLEKVTIGWVKGNCEIWGQKFSGSEAEYFFKFSLQMWMSMQEAEGFQIKCHFGYRLHPPFQVRFIAVLVLAQSRILNPDSDRVNYAPVPPI